MDSRQEDGQGCRELETEWKNFNTSADQAVPGLEGELDASQTDLAISSLNNLNNRWKDSIILPTNTFNTQRLFRGRPWVLHTGKFSSIGCCFNYCQNKVNKVQ